MSKYRRLLNLCKLQRIQLEQMQGHVYFIQDDNGCLRRWTPPQPKPDAILDEDKT